MVLLLQETQRFDPVHQFSIWGGLKYTEDCKKAARLFRIDEMLLKSEIINNEWVWDDLRSDVFLKARSLRNNVWPLVSKEEYSDLR